MDALPIAAPRQAGIYVRRAREAQGMTRSQLAAASGVSERLLASLELGDATGIRLDKLLAVFSTLGLSLVARGGEDRRVGPRSGARARGDARRPPSQTSSLRARRLAPAHFPRPPPTLTSFARLRASRGSLSPRGQRSRGRH